MAIDKVQTGLRLETEALRKITLIAKKQKRSLNSQIEFLVQKAIDEYEEQFGIILPSED